MKKYSLNKLNLTLYLKMDIYLARMSYLYTQYYGKNNFIKQINNDIHLLNQTFSKTNDEYLLFASLLKQLYLINPLSIKFVLSNKNEDFINKVIKKIKTELKLF